MRCAARSRRKGAWSSATPAYPRRGRIDARRPCRRRRRESDGDLMGDGVNIAARLESVATPGAICLSEDAYRQAKGEARTRNVCDLGPIQLKNIAEPIRVYYFEVGQPAQQKPAPPAPEKLGPPRLSLVVLPFANIGGDAEQGHFADGVTESLTTDLSRISGAFVIARNTAFTFQGQAVEREADRTRSQCPLRAGGGSVQRSGICVRVNVQLIEAETGASLVGGAVRQAVDRPLRDARRDRISSRQIVLGYELEVAEARHAERAPNPDSMDHYFLGLGSLQQGCGALMVPGQGPLPNSTAPSHSIPNNGGRVWLAGSWVDITLVWPLWLSITAWNGSRSAEADLTRRRSRLRGGPTRGPVRLGRCAKLKQLAGARHLWSCERALAINPKSTPHAHGWIGFRKIYGRAKLTRPRGMSSKRSASVLSDPLRVRLEPWSWGSPSWVRSPTTKRWSGSIDRLLSIRETIRLISFYPLRWRTSAEFRKRAKPRDRASSSVRTSPSLASEPGGSATTPSITPAANGCTRACAWRDGPEE